MHAPPPPTPQLLAEIKSKSRRGYREVLRGPGGYLYETLLTWRPPKAGKPHGAYQATCYEHDADECQKMGGCLTSYIVARRWLVSTMTTMSAQCRPCEHGSWQRASSPPERSIETATWQSCAPNRVAAAAAAAAAAVCVVVLLAVQCGHGTLPPVDQWQGAPPSISECG